MKAHSARLTIGAVCGAAVATATIGLASTGHAATNQPSASSTSAESGSSSSVASSDASAADAPKLIISASPAPCTSATTKAREHTTWLTVTAPKGVGTRTYQIFVHAAQDSPAQINQPSLRLAAGQRATERVSWPADFGWLDITVLGGTWHGSLISASIVQEGPTSAPDPKLYTDCSASSQPTEPPTPSPVTTTLPVTG